MGQVGVAMNGVVGVAMNGVVGVALFLQALHLIRSTGWQDVGAANEKGVACETSVALCIFSCVAVSYQ